jgi:hypothetical protein
MDQKLFGKPSPGMKNIGKPWNPSWIELPAKREHHLRGKIR